jgi:hypothetical protein
MVGSRESTPPSGCGRTWEWIPTVVDRSSLSACPTFRMRCWLLMMVGSRESTPPSGCGRNVCLCDRHQLFVGLVTARPRSAGASTPRSRRSALRRARAAELARGGRASAHRVAPSARGARETASTGTIRADREAAARSSGGDEQSRSLGRAWDASVTSSGRWAGPWVRSGRWAGPWYPNKQRAE